MWESVAGRGWQVDRWVWDLGSVCRCAGGDMCSWFWHGLLWRLEAWPGVPGGPWRDAFLTVRLSELGSSPSSRPGLLEVWSADCCHEISKNIESRCLEISIATWHWSHIQVHQQCISLFEQDIDPFGFCGAYTCKFTPGWSWELATCSGTTRTMYLSLMNRSKTKYKTKRNNLVLHDSSMRNTTLDQARRQWEVRLRAPKSRT